MEVRRPREGGRLGLFKSKVGHQPTPRSPPNYPTWGPASPNPGWDDLHFFGFLTWSVVDFHFLRLSDLVDFHFLRVSDLVDFNSFGFLVLGRFPLLRFAGLASFCFSVFLLGRISLLGFFSWPNLRSTRHDRGLVPVPNHTIPWCSLVRRPGAFSSVKVRLEGLEIGFVRLVPFPITIPNCRLASLRRITLHRPRKIRPCREPHPTTQLAVRLLQNRPCREPHLMHNSSRQLDNQL
jgi:hypothetical protein